MKANIEPWERSLQERLEKLSDKTKKKVVYISHEMNASTFRYRVYNMCQSLDNSNAWIGSYFIESELIWLREHLNQIDIIVISRMMWSLEVDQFISLAKDRRIPIIFDVDDLVFDVKKIPLLMNTLNVDFSQKGAIDYWFSYISEIFLVASKCDYGITTNKFLQERLESIFTFKSFVIPNFLNEEQISVSEKICKNEFKQSKKFIIGYFSGTPSHINDFSKVVPTIIALLEKYENIYVEVVGYMSFPKSLEKFVQSKRIKKRSLVDFQTLQERIAGVDVNIIPLVNNEFTNCKSELKYFEASIVGTPSIATPTYVYKENIIDGKNGFLSSDVEWFEKIEEIYKKEIDSNLITSAKDYCINKYSPKNQYENIEKMLNHVILNR